MAVTRSLPKVEYFLPLVHPTKREEIIFKESTTNKKRRVIVKLEVFKKQSLSHKKSLSLKSKRGVRKNIISSLLKGLDISLARSLIASTRGCVIPTKVTLFTPKRSCVNPRYFRSRRVIKATLNIIKRLVKSLRIIKKIFFIYFCCALSY